MYVGDPVNIVNIFNGKEVDELIFLDIAATAQKKIQFDLLAEIAQECFMPFTYGGGIASLDDVEKLFTLGVEKVGVNSAAFAKPDFITQISRRFGSQSVVVSIDVKKSRFTGKYSVATEGGRKKVSGDLLAWVKLFEDAGAGEILLTAIDRDGTFAGYDLALVEQVAQVTTLPVIICGGAGNVDDFRAALEADASALAVGSMVIYQGANRSVLINFPRREVLDKITSYIRRNVKQ